MARFTSIGMSRKKFVASAAEEARADADTHQPDAGPSAVPDGNNDGSGDAGDKKKKKRRGRERVRGEDGKRMAIGEKKGPDAKKGSDAKKAGGWTRDEKIARRAKLTAKHAEERKQRRVDQKNSGTTCFACRSVGHASKDCPNILLAAAGGDDAEGTGDVAASNGAARGMKRKGGKLGGDITGGKCYRCNGTDHSLSGCPEPYNAANPTPYATCYICLGTGHLASLCPSNGGKGIYVNGGSCKVCGSVAHRAKDCPDDKRGKDGADGDGGEEGFSGKRRRGEIVLGVGNGAGADEDDFMVEAREGLKSGAGAGKKKKHAPARNSERPMKRLREVDPSTGELGGRLEGGFHPADQVPIQNGSGSGSGAGAGAGQETERIPLTGRKPVNAQASAAKPKAKVVAF
ncbi:hypothetical protein IAT40_006835 [Kwoniella sp. CBS 6097]